MTEETDFMNKEELQEEIKKLNKRLNTIMKNTSLEILTLEQNGDITSSTHSQQGFHISPENIDKEKTNIFTLESVVNSELYDIFQQTLNTGDKVNAGPIYTTHEGQEVYINIKAIPNRDESNQVTGLTAIIEDVTEKAKLELEINKLAEITNASADAIIRLGIFERIESWNKGAEQILGYNENEIVGQKFEEIAPKENKKEIRELWKKIFKEGFVRNYETNSLHKDGNLVPVNITATTMKDNHNNIVGVSVVIKDLTEKKKYEQQIIKYSEDLEQSNKLKDLFTDIMRHDLLNPVGVIKGSTELLMTIDFPSIIPKEKKEMFEFLAMIDRGTTKLEDMIQSASKLAKVENSESLEYRDLDLATMIHDSVNVLETMARKNNMKVVNNVKGNYPATVNPFIEDVFLNFINNAIKYAPSGTRIDVDIEDEGKSWKVMVKDQGETIPDVGKKQIFDRFNRREKGEIKGTGLGLAIVQRIVNLHKGKVWVEDNHPTGNIFCVSIPKKTDKAIENTEKTEE